MKTFYLVTLFVLIINTTSFACLNSSFTHQDYKSDILFLKNQYFVQKSSKILVSGFNFDSTFENIPNGNIYQRYRIHLLTLSLILIGVFFGVFYPRMTQPPIKNDR